MNARPQKKPKSRRNALECDWCGASLQACVGCGKTVNVKKNGCFCVYKIIWSRCQACDGICCIPCRALSECHLCEKAKCKNCVQPGEKYKRCRVCVKEICHGCRQECPRCQKGVCPGCMQVHLDRCSIKAEEVPEPFSYPSNMDPADLQKELKVLWERVQALRKCWVCGKREHIRDCQVCQGIICENWDDSCQDMGFGLKECRVCEKKCCVNCWKEFPCDFCDKVRCQKCKFPHSNQRFEAFQRNSDSLCLICYESYCHECSKEGKCPKCTE